MNPCLLFAALIAVLVDSRTGSTWKGFQAGLLVLTMWIVWVYLMAERETRMALEAEEAEEPEKKDSA